MVPLAHSVDIAILVVFLLVNLAVGLNYGRRVVTLEDYATGGRNFSTPILTATIVATWITGSFIFVSLEETYTRGLYYIIASTIGGFIGIVLTGMAAGRMGRFLRSLSVAGAMKNLYGERVQKVTAVSGVFNQIGWLALQFQVLSTTASLLLGLEGPLVTIVTAIIVIAYSSFGGIRAVTFTDGVQFITFGVFIPTIGLIIWNNIPNSGQLVYQTLSTTPYFDVREVIRFTPEFMSTIGWMLCFSIPAIAPEVFQRIVMAKDALQARKAFIYAAGIILLADLFVVWIAILLLADSPNLSKDQIVPYLVNKHSYAGFRGIFGVGIIAMAMSSADSFLNSAAVMVANDIVPTAESDTKKRLFVARSSTLLIGAISLVLALYAKDIFGLALLACSFYLPIVTVPLLFSILGFRTSTRTILVGMASGFITVVLWSIYYNNGDSITPGMVANAAAIIASHYLFGAKGGWGADRLEQAQTTLKREEKPGNCSSKSFKLSTCLQRNLPTNEAIYFYFGLYILCAIYTACYTIEYEQTDACPTIFRAVCYTVPLLASSFMIFPLLTQNKVTKLFITYYWPAGIGIALFVSNTLLAVISHFSPIQTGILMINLLVALWLLHWSLALSFAAGGIAISLLSFKVATGGAIPMEALGTPWYTLSYMVLPFMGFLVVFLKQKQTQRLLAARGRELANENSHLLPRDNEEKECLLALFKNRLHCMQALKKLNLGDLSGATGLQPCIKRLLKGQNPFAKDLTILMPTEIMDGINRGTIDYMQLSPSSVNIATLLKEVEDTFQEKTLYIRNNSQQKQLFCDAQRIKKVLINSIRVLRASQEDATSVLCIGLDDTALTYEMTSADKEAQKVPAVAFTVTADIAMFAPRRDARQPMVEENYPAQRGEEWLVMATNNHELLLLTNQRIIEAHCGYTDVVPQENRDTYVYAIPVQLNEVSGNKESNLASPEPGTSLVRADDTYPGEKQQEEALLMAVKQHPKVDIEAVKTAIEMAKWYHGPAKQTAGAPSYLDAIAVAQTVLDYNQDQPTLLAALLNGTVEDTNMLLAHIALTFDEETAHIVEGGGQLESRKNELYNQKVANNKSLRKLLRLKDKRALYVKLAERVHAMGSIKTTPYKDQRRIADGTLNFFVPLAEKLGFPQVAEALKKTSMEVVSRKEEGA